MDTERWYFIGIGGAGMSALASALLDMGDVVSGSDTVESDVTRALVARGARVAIGHSAANLGDATRVVVSAAVPPDNPELLEAQTLGLPIIKRAALLGMLMDAKRGVAVAGTHGKTTTSAMIAWILAKAGRDASYVVGGTIRGLGPGGHWGGGPDLVAEADEYDSSFLHLHPEVAVITNIEADHLDYYGSIEAIFASFAEFALNTKPGGLLLICEDDPKAKDLAAQLLESAAPFRVQLYGTRLNSLWRAREVGPSKSGGIEYAIMRGDIELATIVLRVPGRHNMLNSLAALAACVELGISTPDAARWLGEFEGAERRFELVGSGDGVTVVDDYAHHPSEITATLEAARQRYPGNRLVVLFQPHTYTRTRDFLDDFASALSAADRVIVSEIYASREHDTLGMSGRMIVAKISPAHAEFAPTLRDATEMLLDDLAPGDLLLTMGAGDVWKVGKEVLSALQERETEREPAALPPANLVRHIPEDDPGRRRRHSGSQGVGDKPRASVAFASDLAARLEKDTGLRPVRDEPMTKHNSLRIGGPAKLFVVANSGSELVRLVLFAQSNDLPYLVIGNGTNILVGDYGIDGLVIHNKSRDISHEMLDDDTSLWQVDSGVLFSRLARITCEAGWTGQEWASSVPGSVGGGVVSNAGAHDKELKDDLVSIDVLTRDGTLESWPTSALELGYRTSRFKAQGSRSFTSPQEIVLRAHIKLFRDVEGACEARMRGFLEERQAKQPQGKSAGSTFKNPPGNSAGYLIEQVGMKGYRHGQAQFSPKHANFMMNLGGATAADVRYLMSLARDKVLEEFGIELEPEIEFVGDALEGKLV